MIAAAMDIAEIEAMMCAIAGRMVNARKADAAAARARAFEAEVRSILGEVESRRLCDEAELLRVKEMAKKEKERRRQESIDGIVRKIWELAPGDRAEYAVWGMSSVELLTEINTALRTSQHQGSFTFDRPSDYSRSVRVTRDRDTAVRPLP